MDRWRRSQGVEDREDVKMLVGHNMQGYGASLVFLRTAGVGDEDEGDEAKRMGETYASMVLALYVGDPLV